MQPVHNSPLKKRTGIDKQLVCLALYSKPYNSMQILNKSADCIKCKFWKKILFFTSVNDEKIIELDRDMRPI